MGKHKNKLSLRIQSLYGKVIIINALILSKTSFFSNIFPTDTKTTSLVQNNIFKYVWKNKQEPIARKTIFLNKKLRELKLVLNFLEPQAHNFAIRINQLLQLKQKHQKLILEEHSNLLVSNGLIQLLKRLTFLHGQ